MSNPRIMQVTRPAERMRGCRLATDFRSALDMARDGWTSFGSPTYYKTGGLILNGATQYLTRPLAGELSAAAITGHVEFWDPSFAPNDSANHYLLNNIDAAVMAVFKDNSNNIKVMFNSTTVLTAAYAAWSAYWNATGKNVLSFSVASGANLLWLNGNQIATSATAWTATNSTVLYVGRYRGGAIYYWGARITRFYIGHHTSTLAEHTAYWTNSMFSWRNRLTVDLPFGIGQYDPDNKQTLDVSGHDNHATLGDGAGTGEPTQGRGFLTLDGVNDYLSGIANPAGSYTVLGYEDTGTGWTFFSNNDLTKWTPIMTSGGFTGKLGHLAVAPEVLNATQLLDAAIQLRQYGSEV